MRFYLARGVRAIWFLPAVFSVLAILGLVASWGLDSLLPSGIADRLGSGVIDRILSILASSMLAVAIFSLSTMVTAVQAATRAATPRVRRLLVEDRTAQTAISIFIGAFLFSLLGIIGLSTGIYGDSGRLVLFVLTMLIVVAVIVALIHWIQKLSDIGGVRETVDRAENATRKAFASPAAFDYGGRPSNRSPEAARPVSAKQIGYVQNVDGERLGALSEECDLRIHVAARPGAYVDPTRPLAYVSGDASDEACKIVRRTFVIGSERVFDSDPAFGLIVLAEIALRALSPAVNDPGTAIDVIGAQTRILDEWGARLESADADVRFRNLSVAELDPDQLFADAFAAIAREGAGIAEVQARLHESLATLAAMRPTLFGAPALKTSYAALERARATMRHPSDIAAVEALAAAVGNATVPDPAWREDAKSDKG